MAIVNYSATLDGSTDITTLNGGTLSWDAGWIGYFSTYLSTPGDTLDATISLTGSNWDIAALRFGANTDNITRLADLDADTGRTITYLKLGQNSDVDLISTRVKYIEGGDGALHDVTLGTAHTNSVNLYADVNRVTTGSGHVQNIDTGGRDQITIGSGGAGRIYTGDRRDIVTVGDGGYADHINTGDGNDKVTLRDGGAGQVRTGDGNDTVNVRQDGFAASLRMFDGTKRLNISDNGRVNSVELGDALSIVRLSGDARISTYQSGNTDNDIRLTGDARIYFMKMDEGTNKLVTGAGNVESIFTWNSSNTFNIGAGGVSQIQMSANIATNQVINSAGYIGQVRVTGDQSTNLNLTGDRGAGSIQLGNGNDRVTTDGGFVELISTRDGNDKVTIGDGGAAMVRTGDGHDRVTTGNGFVDFISTSDGGDRVTIGSGGAASVRTGDDNDLVITGSGWVETISTGNGNDVVDLGTGGGGLVRTSNGNDTIILSEINPDFGVRINGGSGVDTLDFSRFSTGVTFTLDSAGIFQNPGAPGGDLDTPAVGYFSEIGIENLIGSRFDDVLTGDDNRNRLEGGLGRDELDGQAGKDVLIGGRGNDTVTGGGGLDEFVFGAQSGTDHVTDFQDGADTLVIADHVGGFGSLTISDSGANLRIVHDGGVIILDGLAGTILTQADFDFV